VVLSAPELVVPEPVEVLHQIEVAPEQQRWALAQRMVRSQERAEAEPIHHRRTLEAGPDAVLSDWRSARGP
jgi:hypothetical protein